MQAIPFEFYRMQGNYKRRAKFSKHGVKFFWVNLLSDSVVVATLILKRRSQLIIESMIV